MRKSKFVTFDVQENDFTVMLFCEVDPKDNRLTIYKEILLNRAEFLAVKNVFDSGLTHGVFNVQNT